MFKNRSLYLLSFLLALTSCNDTAENPNKVLWGETKYYTDFLFKKYKPVIMEQTLEFEFNRDAQRAVRNNIELEAVEKDETGRFIPTTDVVLYKDEEKCPNNILKINISDRGVKLGIEFDSGAKEGNHTLYLRVKNTGGLDRIDDVDLSSRRDVILTHEWIVKKDNVYNPLAKGLFWTLILIVALLIVWRIFVRRKFFETFKVRTLYIFYPESPMKTLRIKNHYKIVCSNRKQTQPFISKFLKGKIIFVKHEFWTQDMEIIPRDRRSVRIRPSRGFTMMPSNTIITGVVTEITSMNKITKLQIN